MKIMELSRERFEDFVINKVKERLSKIVWGENCDSIKDALLFPYEWFMGEIADINLRSEMENYLTTEGFKLKKYRVNNQKRYMWEFPSNSSNVKFCNLFNEFSTSLKEVTCDFFVSSEKLLHSFIESSDSVITENVQNSIYRKALSDKISSYNRERLIINRRNRKPDNCDFFYFHESSNGDVIFLSKHKEYHGFDKTIEEMYNFVLSSLINSFFALANNILHNNESKVKPNKFVMHIPSTYYEGIKNILEPLGFYISYMPQYPESKYVCVGTKAANQIPIYIEVCDLIYVFFKSDYLYLNRLYGEFYKYYQ